MKAKTTGQATPVRLRLPLKRGCDWPSWSAGGDWIACGNELISPDGKTVRSLGKGGTPSYAFSADGKLVYGIRSEGGKNRLFSVNVADGVETILGEIGKDFAPRGQPRTAALLSLAPDGKSLAYSIQKRRGNIWMVEGFDQPPSLLARLGLR